MVNINYTLEIKEEAEEEISDAFTWYEDQKEGLGSELIDILDDYFEILKDNPFLFQIASGDERVAVVRKFPYKIVYGIESDKVIVYSVFHTHRNPK